MSQRKFNCVARYSACWRSAGDGNDEKPVRRGGSVRRHRPFHVFASSRAVSRVQCGGRAPAPARGYRPAVWTVVRTGERSRPKTCRSCTLDSFETGAPFCRSYPIHRRFR
ncbi:hypothetical protein JTB14_017392 [Gonioctena quinquepunctata]|nr:hypothetical protein JTB14_017392 [Gonioctena quinquepunctata]